MADVEVFVFLLLAVAVLAGLGLRSGVPYPVALVLGGLVIGVVPGCRRRSSTPISCSPPSCRRCSMPPPSPRPRTSFGPARTETILEGESLVNDGTGLTAYTLAVAAAVGGGAGGPGEVALKLVAVAAGGLPIGTAVGWLFGRLRSYLVIFLAYATVVLTLVVPGLTLAPLLKRLGLSESERRRRADAEARLRVTHAALERLEQTAAHDGPPSRLQARRI